MGNHCWVGGMVLYGVNNNFMVSLKGNARDSIGICVYCGVCMYVREVEGRGTEEREGGEEGEREYKNHTRPHIQLKNQLLNH